MPYVEAPPSAWSTRIVEAADLSDRAGSGDGNREPRAAAIRAVKETRRLIAKQRLAPGEDHDLIGWLHERRLQGRCQRVSREAAATVDGTVTW
jgi:hypothetical protein